MSGLERGMRVLVCGGRDYTDRDELDDILDRLASVFAVGEVIEGEAPGADTMAADWARARGISLAPYPAEWRTYGKAAGRKRNRRMLNEGRPDLVIAFPTIASKGTWDMVTIARTAGLPVWIMPADRSKIDAIGEGVFR